MPTILAERPPSVFDRGQLALPGVALGQLAEAQLVEERLGARVHAARPDLDEVDALRPRPSIDAPEELLAEPLLLVRLRDDEVDQEHPVLGREPEDEVREPDEVSGALEREPEREDL